MKRICSVNYDTGDISHESSMQFDSSTPSGMSRCVNELLTRIEKKHPHALVKTIIFYEVK